jgi:hypothetical protein
LPVRGSGENPGSTVPPPFSPGDAGYFYLNKGVHAMNAYIAFRWLHAEEILLGRKPFETGVSRPARKPVPSVTPRAAGIPIPQRIAPGVAA